MTTEHFWMLSAFAGWGFCLSYAIRLRASDKTIDRLASFTRKTMREEHEPRRVEALLTQGYN